VSNTMTLESRFADIGGGCRLHYHDVGQGMPVVFLHGSGPGASSLSNFRGNYAYLVERGYRAILVDSLGYGQSSKPLDGGYHLNGLNAALSRFLDAIGVAECAVVGNSLGGAMALRLAIDEPKRVRAVVALAPGGLAGKDAYFRMSGIQKLFEVAMKGAQATVEDMRALFSLQLHDATQLSPALLEERLAVAKTQPKEVFLGLRVPDLSGELDLLQCPVLAFWGANDNFCPIETSPILLEKVPQARIVQVTRCGHWVQVEYPELFNETTAAFLQNACGTR